MISLDFKMFFFFFGGGVPHVRTIFHLFMMCDLDGQICYRLKIDIRHIHLIICFHL